MTTTDEKLEKVRARIIEIAEKILDQGTLVPGGFVIPADLGYALGDAFDDLDLVEDEAWATST